VATRSGPRPRTRFVAVVVALGVVVTALAACSSSSPERPAARSSTTTTRSGAATTPTTTAPPPAATQLLAVVADGLTVYEATSGGSSKRLLDRTADGLGGRAPTGQVCPVPAPDRRVAVGLTPGAPTDPPAWAIIAISGEQLDGLSARVVGLVTTGTTPNGASGTTPTGCTALGDGRLVTSDTSGRLAVWIPPLGSSARSCTLLAGLGAPGQLGQDDQRRVYVTVGDGADAGVFRIAAPAVTSPDAAGGCGGTDQNGLPLADRVRREPFLAAAPDGPARPQGIAIDQAGPVLVASPTPGPIVETDPNGAITRRITSSGRPLGLAVDPDGSLYVADPGDGSPTGGRLLVLPNGPNGLQAGVVLVAGVDRPQSITVLVPAGGGGASKL